MAEFQEVCRQWRRMCDKHTCSRNKDAFTGLLVCPIAVEHEGYPCDEDPIDWTEKATKQLEEIVMSWAAEHSEPVYPTFGEWLEKQGIVKLVNGDRYEEDGRKVYMLLESVENQIPADIAQKLEIEPMKTENAACGKDYCELE